MSDTMRNVTPGTETKFGCGIFFDGFTNARHAVAVMLGTDAIEISVPNGPVLSTWPLAHISSTMAPKSVLRLGIANSKVAARLELRDAALVAELRRRIGMPEDVATLRTRTKGASWSLAAAAVLVAGVVWGVPLVADGAVAHVPLAYEMQLGARTATQMAPLECGGKPGQQEGLAAFNKLVGTLEKAADLQQPIHVAVVKSPVLNAIAVPGGRIYFYEAYLQKAASVDEVAGVLAHEMGHIAHHDGAKGVIERGAASMVFGKMLGHFAGGDAASNAANQVMRLSYSRGVEDAADAFGGALMSKVGGDPRANGYLLERGVKESDLPPHFLLDHAEPKRRSANLARIAPPEVHKELLTSQEFAALKKICS